ncbi:Ceramide synthase [Crenichthys baileyi]|uniref:Ceramide synthase n=1 Tax=Crenichthys baileyi TaxID=28760 RepID=A0AAV9SBW7_9TELE
MSPPMSPPDPPCPLLPPPISPHVPHVSSLSPHDSPHPFLSPAGQLWRQGKGDYFQGILFLAELSTPSVCLGKVLIQYQKQNSVLHKVNGVFMLLSFFSCRVLLFPYLYYAYSRYASIPLYWVPLVAPWQCNLGAALLWPLQLYWFALICRGALRQSGRRLKANGSTDSSTRKLTGGR